MLFLILFPFKKKIKISDDSNFLQKSIFYNKKRVSPSSRNVCEKYKSTPVYFGMPFLELY